MSRKYNTEQRNLIDNLLARGGDYSCDEIVAKLCNEGNPVSTPTVYRHLKLLSENGVLNTYYVGGKKRYKLAKLNQDTAILKCNKCGKNFILDCIDLLNFKHHIKLHHDFVIDTSSLIFYGMCNDCFEKSKKEGNEK